MQRMSKNLALGLTLAILTILCATTLRAQVTDLENSVSTHLTITAGPPLLVAPVGAFTMRDALLAIYGDMSAAGWGVVGGPANPGAPGQPIDGVVSGVTVRWQEGTVALGNAGIVIAMGIDGNPGGYAEATATANNSAAFAVGGLGNVANASGGDAEAYANAGGGTAGAWGGDGNGTGNGGYAIASTWTGGGAGITLLAEAEGGATDDGDAGFAFAESDGVSSAEGGSTTGDGDGGDAIAIADGGDATALGGSSAGDGNGGHASATTDGGDATATGGSSGNDGHGGDATAISDSGDATATGGDTLGGSGGDAESHCAGRAEAFAGRTGGSASRTGHGGHAVAGATNGIFRVPSSAHAEGGDADGGDAGNATAVASGLAEAFGGQNTTSGGGNADARSTGNGNATAVGGDGGSGGHATARVDGDGTATATGGEAASSGSGNGGDATAFASDATFSGIAIATGGEALGTGDGGSAEAIAAGGGDATATGGDAVDGAGGNAWAEAQNGGNAAAKGGDADLTKSTSAGGCAVAISEQGEATATGGNGNNNWAGPTLDFTDITKPNDVLVNFVHPTNVNFVFQPGAAYAIADGIAKANDWDGTAQESIGGRGQTGGFAYAESQTDDSDAYGGWGDTSSGVTTGGSAVAVASSGRGRGWAGDAETTDSGSSGGQGYAVGTTQYDGGDPHGSPLPLTGFKATAQ
jgi:hypothetical protein